MRRSCRKRYMGAKLPQSTRVPCRHSGRESPKRLPTLLSNAQLILRLPPARTVRTSTPRLALSCRLPGAPVPPPRRLSIPAQRALLPHLPPRRQPRSAFSASGPSNPKAPGLSRSSASRAGGMPPTLAASPRIGRSRMSGTRRRVRGSVAPTAVQGGGATTRASPRHATRLASRCLGDSLSPLPLPSQASLRRGPHHRVPPRPAAARASPRLFLVGRPLAGSSPPRRATPFVPHPRPPAPPTLGQPPLPSQRPLRPLEHRRPARLARAARLRPRVSRRRPSLAHVSTSSTATALRSLPKRRTCPTASPLVTATRSLPF